MEPRGERREKAPDGRVREALPAELDSLAPVLARAFERDPVYRWIVPDDARWRRVAPGLFRELLRLFAATGTVLTDDTAAGAALWNPPEPRRRSLRERAAFALALCVRLRVATPRLARVGGILSSLQPREPHWYLGVLGVDAGRRRRGVGAGLMAPILARCDDERLPAYLETAVEENLAFYGKRGFAVVGDAVVPGGPRIWAMRRPPRGGAGS